VVTKKSNSILEVITLVNHDVVQQATTKDEVRKLLQIRPPHGMVQYAPSSFQPCKGHLHYHPGAHVLVVEIILDTVQATYIRWIRREEPWSKRITLVPNNVLSQRKPLQQRKKKPPSLKTQNNLYFSLSKEDKNAHTGI
jgi:hypothetical protein